MELKQSPNRDWNQTKDITLQTRTCLHSKQLGLKWWSKSLEKMHVLLQKTKSGEKLLVEELHDKLFQDKNRRVIICESFSDCISPTMNTKNGGGGGVGKTITAQLYAENYEHEFNHIIWIDCGGQKSLFEVFKTLSLELKVKNWNKLSSVVEFAASCFEILADCKCLWIYDNVESCEENERIEKVTPENQRNSFCLIVSRNRNIFTAENEDEKATYFPVDRFNEEDGIRFLKDSFTEGMSYNEDQLKEVCVQLQHLPLALHLAVATLNAKKIDLSSYMEQLKSKDAEIAESSLDSCEEIINRTIKIALDLILQEVNGKTAHDILLTFGYIPPKDTEVRFFEVVLNVRNEISKAIDLLIKYSLVSKKSKISDKTCDLLSVQRLVQQVIRYKNKENEKEILRKIFNCLRFLSYQVYPFQKYADKELRKEFPKIWILHLKQLIREKKFKESLTFASEIHKEFNTNTSLYNYLVCLEKVGDLEETVKILEELYKKEGLDENMGNFYYEEDLIEMGRQNDFVETGIIKMGVELTKDIVGGHLMVIYWKMGYKEKVKEILEGRKIFATVYSKESLKLIFEIVDFNPINSNYTLEGNNHKGIRLKFGGETKQIDFFESFIDSNICFPEELQDLSLRYVKFTNENDKEIKNFDMSHLISLKLNKIRISSRVCLSLERISSVDHVDFSECTIILDSSCRLNPQELKFFWVTFMREGKILEQASANDFLNFKRIKNLELTCHTNMNISIDLSSEEVIIDTLELKHAEVLNWEKAKWTVGKLYLLEVPFLQKTNMKITEMELVWGPLDISCLPDTIERLPLSFNTELRCSEEISLPKLKYLTLNQMGGSCLSHFSKCKNLSHIVFWQMKEVNVDLFPEGVICVRIVNPADNSVISGVKEIDSVILEHCSMGNIENILSHLHPKNHLELNYCRVDPNSNILPTDLQELSLIKVTFSNENVPDMKTFDLTQWISIKCLRKLTFDGYGYATTPCSLSLDKLCSMSIEYLNLTKCCLILDCNCRLSPKVLQLNEVSFIKEGKEAQIVAINAFTDLCNVEELKLTCRETKKNIFIDLSDMSLCSTDTDAIHLSNVIVKK